MAAAAEAPQKEEAPAPVAPPAPRRPAHRAVAKRPPVEDPRWNQIQQQLGEQQKALAESKQQIAETQANLQQARSELEGNLQSARNELGGSIARTHEELVALQKKGERNYYEFNIGKSKAYHHNGPISISLRKVNDKHEYCDLDMLVNDTGISKKHVNLYESVTFYPEGYLQPVELVINDRNNGQKRQAESFHVPRLVDAIVKVVDEKRKADAQDKTGKEPEPKVLGDVGRNE